MGTYIHKFDSENAYNTARSSSYVEPWVSSTVITGGNRVNYNKRGIEKLLATPLTFEILSDGAIKWAVVSDSVAKTIEYKKNDGEWTSITSNLIASAPTISVETDDIVQFRGDNDLYNIGGWANYFAVTSNFNISGNIMSLISSTNFPSLTSFSADNALYGLFKNCETLISAQWLMLPATTLRFSCYRELFSGCSNLTIAPTLPAMTLASTCYNNMFENCTSLITAPNLPATTLDTSCYGGMFAGCTSLVNVFASLPAQTLPNYCYSSMFEGCTSLTSAPEIEATTLGGAQPCNKMFKNCTNLTTPPSILKPTTLTNSCYTYMFENCTNLTTSPILPAETLITSCYNYMFRNCSSLNYITALFTTTPSVTYTSSWVENVAEYGTFVKNSNASWQVYGKHGIPNQTKWTAVDYVSQS